jgi:iron complex transport system permease protein
LWRADHYRSDEGVAFVNRLAILIVAAVIAFALSLIAGKVWIAPAEWFAGGNGAWIMAELRLPRALLGATIGAVLGLSGAVLQGYLRNPLADPTVIGVSSTAALGGVAAILIGLSPFPLAMIGAAASVILLAMLAGRGSGQIGFILAGMVLATLSGALTAFLISIAPNPYAVGEILAWTMGALTDRSTADAARAIPLMILGGLILATIGRSLDALTLGEDAARSLGVDPVRLQWRIAAGVGLCVGAAVAVSGVVGFVGLIVPHLVRPLFGERPSAILLPSALAGAALLLIADAAVRLVPGPGEIRLGIAMAVLGAPFFFVLLLRKSGKQP